MWTADERIDSLFIFDTDKLRNRTFTKERYGRTTLSRVAHYFAKYAIDLRSGASKGTESNRGSIIGSHHRHFHASSSQITRYSPTLDRPPVLGTPHTLRG